MTTYDFTIKQGIKFTKSITWKDSNNTAYDITGYSAMMQLRKDFDSAVIIELSTSNGEITLDELNGKVSLLLTDVETAALDEDDFPCVYDLELYDSTGVAVKRLIEGKITLSREATK